MSSAASEPGGPVPLPAVNDTQMAEADRIMVEHLGIAIDPPFRAAGIRWATIAA